MGNLSQKNIEPLFKTRNGRLIKYLNLLKRRALYHDYDYFIVIVGKERRGKTTLEAQVGHYMTDGKFTADNMCMDAEEFTSFFQDVPKGGVACFDEGGTNLYSREAMTTINRTLTKCFMVSGIKNCGIIVCIPSFFLLDSYVRNHRIDLLIYIHKRGKFKAFSHKRAKAISIKGAKNQNMSVGIPANDVGWFPKKWPNKDVEKEYRIKEKSYKLGFIKDLKNLLDGYHTTSQFCRATGYDLRTIYRWIKAKKIKYKKVGKKWFIPKSEADRIVQEQQAMSYDDS